MTAPPLGNPAPLPPEEKHSGLGIVSFIMSLVVGCLMFATFVSAAVLSGRRTPGERTYPGQMLVGVGIIFLLALDVVPIALGIASLCQRGRKRLYGILGLAFSAALLVGTIGLMIIGFIYMSRAGR